jgi:predicted DNA-binding ArsR family transcriptional regulator
MLERLLRYPLPDQIKALCEKIDLLDDDDASSLAKIDDLIDHMRFYERLIARRAIKLKKRARVLNRAMELVIGSKNDYDRF